MKYALLMFLIHLFLSNTFIFTFSVFSGTDKLYVKSLQVIQLPTHLSELIKNR